MKLKKFIPELASAIVEAGFDKTPKDLQSLCIPKIKSGVDMIVAAPAGSGKSTTVAIAIIQQLKKAVDDLPRAICVSPDKDHALALEAQFIQLAKNTDLRIFTAYDQGVIQFQKDLIYEGMDILIATPRRLHELMNITGISTMNLKYLVVDDAEKVFPSRFHEVIYRIASGVPKLQSLVFANRWHEKLDSTANRIMKHPIILRVD